MRYSTLLFAALLVVSGCGEETTGSGGGGEAARAGSAGSDAGSGGSATGGTTAGGTSSGGSGGSGSGAAGATGGDAGSGAVGGSGNSGTGGTAGAGGTSGAGTGGTSGAGTGGMAGAGTGGAPVTPTETVVITIPDLPGCNAPYPHDPAVDPATGIVYYADSNVSCIGEYNPETEEYRAWPTPTADSYPHGLVVDDQSRVFYAGQDQDRIGRLVTSGMGMIQDFAVDANGPHTPTFHDGAIWFTAQQGGQYGRFDRETGMSEVWEFSSTSFRPYGMWPAPDGSLWVALFGTNRLARIVTSGATPMVEEFTLPNAQSRPRRIAVDANGRVWYTDYPRRMLGMMDPAAPEASRFHEFEMPGGGQPYGIAIGPDGNVWVDDEDVPEIVGFDVNTRTVITQLPVPVANAGPVRNMSVDVARKRIWLAISNVGHLGLLQF